MLSKWGGSDIRSRNIIVVECKMTILSINFLMLEQLVEQEQGLKMRRGVIGTRAR